jgi:uncharacterized protein with GYD domain
VKIVRNVVEGGSYADVHRPHELDRPGREGADQTVARYDAAKDDLAERGVTIKDIYWTMGPYDIVTVIEAADDETATKGLMRLTSQGNLRSCTMRAFGVDEARSLLA